MWRYLFLIFKSDLTYYLVKNRWECPTDHRIKYKLLGLPYVTDSAEFLLTSPYPGLPRGRALILFRYTILRGRFCLFYITQVITFPLSATGFRGERCAPIMDNGSWREAYRKGSKKDFLTHQRETKAENTPFSSVWKWFLHFFGVYFSYL